MSVIRLLKFSQFLAKRTVNPRSYEYKNFKILARHESTNLGQVPQKIDDDNYKVPEETVSVHGFNAPEHVEEKPLMSLNIEQRIDKLDKKGSFTADFFIGKFDDDFLTYPDPLHDRSECKKLMDQKAMVRQLWPKIWNDNEQLQAFNFFNMFQLSVTEMMTVFEAIGESSRDCYETNLTSSSDKSALFHSDLPDKVEDSKHSEFNHFQVTQSILSLITRNCLTYWPIHKSSNEELKNAFLPKKHILFGGSKEDKDRYLPMGFAWSEQAPLLGTLAPQEWSSRGLHGGQFTNQYALRGKKSRLLADDEIEHYLVFFRDTLLAGQYEDGPKDDEPNPETDPFIGCCLMHKSEMKIGPSYKDSAGFKYNDIEFDTVLEQNREVIKSRRLNPHPLNIKALGQLVTCAVQLGLLKASLRRTYEYLMQKRPGLLSCAIVELKMTYITGKIFAMESMLYYIAGMFDGLEAGFDAHLEAAMFKTVTCEFGYEILQDLQQLCGSDMLNTSRMQDQLNIYDSFLDGAIYNRLYVSTMGLLWYSRNENKRYNMFMTGVWHPGSFIRTKLQEVSTAGEFLTLDADIYGQLHPSMHEAAHNLEWVIKRVKYSADIICRRYGKDVVSHQNELTRLSQLAIDTFMLTAVCSRASKAYCNGAKFAEIDVTLATSFTDYMLRRIRLYVSEFEQAPLYTIESKAKVINELNLRNCGYFPHTPLDPNI